MTKPWSKTIWIGVVLILLIALQSVSAWTTLGNFFNFALEPVQRVIYRSSYTTYGYFQRLSFSRDLVRENDQLRNQLTSLQVDHLDLERLQTENQYLRQQLNFIRDNPLQVVMTEIIGKPLLQNNLLIIDRGANDGLVEGQPVLAGEGILVGRIYEVEPSRAYVALLSNTKSSLAVTINNSQRTQGVLQGNLGLGLTMDLVPLSEQLAIGDIVFSSGFENFATRRFLVGEITNIIKEDNELYQKAEIRPAFDYQNLQHLTVVISQ
ncbi:MAG: rod shape-determining protein MreC [Candidatus Komeilibacteria bacterium]|nr:rod shape-determining protein MreC [Candidatus Komeilibacteria bacterium]